MKYEEKNWCYLTRLAPNGVTDCAILTKQEATMKVGFWYETLS
jgi:hypothetical protein